MYWLKRDSRAFEVYWGKEGKKTQEEARWCKDVAQLYGDCLEYVWGTKEIQPEQLAWYRWYGEEKVGDVEMVHQEMPWTEHQAFVTTGAQYFRSSDLTESARRIVSEVPPRRLRIEVQHALVDTQILEAPAKLANLVIYSGPQEGGHYVLGADPAYGSSEWADGFCISVRRAWGDRIEQVCEFHVIDFQPYQFAWVMCYLAGVYSPCAWNLEITGPGAAVKCEVDNLKRMRFMGDRASRQQMENFLGGMREFLYSRFDSLNRSPVAWGTQSTFKEKNRYMDLYKDYFTRRLAVVHSKPLLEEMRWVVREVGKAPAGSARHKDDRVIAAALAVLMWHDRLRTRLLTAGVTHAAEAKAQAVGMPPKVVSVMDRIADRQRALLGMPRRQ